MWVAHFTAASLNLTGESYHTAPSRRIVRVLLFPLQVLAKGLSHELPHGSRAFDGE